MCTKKLGKQKMTRFELELSGVLGNFWKQHAECESAKPGGESRERDPHHDRRSSILGEQRTVPAQRCLRETGQHGFSFQRGRDQQGEENQQERFLKNYQHETTEEEKTEMRAAFGAGTTVVACSASAASVSGFKS